MGVILYLIFISTLNKAVCQAKRHCLLHPHLVAVTVNFGSGLGPSPLIGETVTPPEIFTAKKKLKIYRSSQKKGKLNKIHLPSIDRSARLSQKIKIKLYFLRLETKKQTPNRWFSLPSTKTNPQKSTKSMTPVVQPEIPGIYGRLFLDGSKSFKESRIWLKKFIGSHK